MGIQKLLLIPLVQRQARLFLYLNMVATIVSHFRVIAVDVRKFGPPSRAKQPLLETPILAFSFNSLPAGETGLGAGATENNSSDVDCSAWVQVSSADRDLQKATSRKIHSRGERNTAGLKVAFRTFK